MSTTSAWQTWANDPTQDRIVLAEVQPAEQLGAFTRDTTAFPPVRQSNGAYISGATGVPDVALYDQLDFIQWPDGALIARVFAQSSGAITAVSITDGGTGSVYPLTKAGGVASGNFRAEIWYLLSPPVAQSGVTYTITLTGSTHVGVQFSVWSRVDQSTPFGTAATTTVSSTTPSVSVTSSTSQMVLDALIASGTPTATVGGSQTQDVNTTDTDRVVGSEETGTASRTMTWTLGSAPANLAQVGIGLQGTTWAYVVSWTDQVAVPNVLGGMYRRLDSVRQDATALTLQTTVSAVNTTAGSYYFDATAKKIYVSTTTGQSPNIYAFIGAWFTIFLSSGEPMFTDQPLYEPRLGGQIPQLNSEVADELFGATIWDDGTLEVANADSAFDILSKSWIWEQKLVTLKLGGSTLGYSDYATVGMSRITTVAADDLKMSLAIQGMADILNRSLPPNTIDANMLSLDGIGLLTPKDGVIGSPSPVMFGAALDCPLVSFSDDGGQERYIFIDNVFSRPNIIDIDTLWAIHDQTGARVDITGGSYTYSFFGHLQLFGATYTTYGTAQGYSLRADLRNESSVTYPGTLARQILALCGEDDANIDTAAFDQADLDAPYPCGLYLNVNTAASDVMRQVEQSGFMRVYIGTDGLWTCRVFDPLRTPAGSVEDADYSTWSASTEDQSVLSEVRVAYAQNFTTGKYVEVSSSDDATTYGRETSSSSTVNTYLTSEVDADELCGRYAFIKRRTRTIIDTTLTGVALVVAQAGDLLTVTRGRAPSVSGAYSSAILLARKVVVGLAPAVTVTLTLDDMADVFRLVGAYAGDTEIDWATASDADKALYGFYSDDDGYIDATDVTTLNRKVYW